MTPLTTIPGLPAETAELLAAAGIRSIDRLSREQPPRLHARLELIAWQRGRSFQAPALEQLAQWIAVAGTMPPEEEAELNVEEIPEAIPLPKPGPAWMPPSLRAAHSADDGPHPEPASEPVRPPSGATENVWRRVDPSSFATLEEYSEGRRGVAPLSRESLEKSTGETASAPADGEEGPRRVQRLRSSGEGLSRWVRRGVVHPRPVHTWCGAVVSLLWRVSFLAGIAAFIWLVAAVEQPSQYTAEVIAGAVVLAVLGLLQLHFSARSRCRICSCNLFYSKNCHKNRKAHLLVPLGYVASLSLHLLIFGWFRCMYCGTAVRLRPGRTRRGDTD
jgi:Domain of unknown function (DUF4332)